MYLDVWLNLRKYVATSEVDKLFTRERIMLYDTVFYVRNLYHAYSNFLFR